MNDSATQASKSLDFRTYLIVLLIGLSAQCVAGATLHPSALECESRIDPIGIDQPTPRLSWKLLSDEVSDAQSAYEIEAASNRRSLEEGAADLWRTGKVGSPKTLWIPYRGTALHSFQDVWWRVRVWSRRGVASNWSAPAHWRAALLDNADRHGSWMAAPEFTLTAGPMPIFRREFSVDRPLRQATLLISGVGFYEASLNGAKVGPYVLAPKWTNYKQSVLYNGFDVTGQIRSGVNALGVMLGNGPFNVVGGRYSKYTSSFGRPRFWAQLHLEFSDGGSAEVTTDDLWKTTAGPVTYSDFYGGEDYDARLAPRGWDEPGFDDAAWSSPGDPDGPGGVLVADAGPSAQVQEHFRAVRVTQPKPGVFVYDLGQNFSGWPGITVQGKAGDQVRLTPGELLDERGLVSQRSSGGPMYYTYTLGGDAVEHWTPRFTYYGFRYVQVEGPPVVKDVEGEFVYLNLPPTGQFESSDETLNRVHHLILSAIKSNLQAVLTDCPHREKLGWLEQSYLMGPSLLFDFDLRTFLPKVLRDIREAQTKEGLIPDIAPEYVIFSDGFRDSPEWGSAGVVLPWFGWQWYGDRGLLEDSYASMKDYVAYLNRKAEHGLLLFGLGDWYDIAPGPPGPSKLTPAGLTSTATYYADLRILADTARLLGHSAEADGFVAQASAERDAFQSAFWKAGATSYATGSQTALAMPLMTGLTSEEDRTAVFAKLVEAIRADKNHTNAGDIGYRYVIDALTRYGASDLIFDMVTEPTPPSYAAQLAAGATTLTEAWDANPRSSQNHLMLGHVEQWFYNGVAGIRPLFSPDGGFDRVLIEPNPVGGLRSAAATWESDRGPIHVDWSMRPSAFELHVAIPPGLEAEVSLPAKDRRGIAAPATATFLRQDGARVLYASGSGKLTFVVKTAAQ